MKSDRSFLKELTGIMLPVAAQNLLSSLVNASDALMLGFLDQASLAAISLATQIAFMLSLFHMSYQTGASVLAAQYWGVRDRENIEKVLGISLRGSMAVSSVFFLLALCFPEFLMRLFTDDAELTALGAQYLRIVSVSYLLMGFSQIYLNIMKNSGRVARSSCYGSATVVCNIVLNLVLIFGWLELPALGIRGAAIATVLSRVLECGLCGIENRRKGEVRFQLFVLFSCYNIFAP